MAFVKQLTHMKRILQNFQTLKRDKTFRVFPLIISDRRALETEKLSLDQTHAIKQTEDMKRKIECEM
ncbi:CLUMA_CG000980, isoform A [Clunio marinus]|uniref:CLUMA_CG000980, isoform A n=1 Tax=Clunio marinus TaxID=568069 RepID=A0A1J1HIE3_9DIPT|nr:CLUMA_CG000980, isoform A [Clunio marinus]